MTMPEQEALKKMIVAVSLRDGGKMKALLEAGLDPNVPMYNANFLIQCAAMHFVEGARLLIKAGAVVDAQDIDGETALLIAAWAAHTAPHSLDMVQLLIEAGADIHHTEKDGCNALTYCASPSLARFLIGKGVDVNAVVGSVETTALAEAAREGFVELAHILLEAGAKVDTRIADDGTALVYCQSSAVAQLLINHGADVNAKTNTGRTALMMAAIEGLVGMTEALLKAGINIDEKDNDGNTALMHAEKNGQMIVAELIEKETAVRDLRRKQKEAEETYKRQQESLRRRRPDFTLRRNNGR